MVILLQAWQAYLKINTPNQNKPSSILHFYLLVLLEIRDGDHVVVIWRCWTPSILILGDSDFWSLRVICHMVNIPLKILKIKESPNLLS